MRALRWASLAALFAAAPAMAEEEGRLGDFNVQARVGVGGFTGGLNEYTSAGPAWGVAVNLQPLRMIGLEFGYEGSRNQINDVRIENAPALMRHGVSAMVKLAPPFVDRIKPFAAIGLGLSHVGVDGQTQALYQNDFIEEVPISAGVEFNSGTLSAGLRATYRALIDEAFADPAQAGGNPEGGLFDVSVSVAARF